MILRIFAFLNLATASLSSLSSSMLVKTLLPQCDSDDFEFGQLNRVENQRSLSLSMETYFSHLSTYSPENTHGSCGYVSLIQAMSYYDTYYNDTIIPETFEYRYSTGSTLNDALTISPGVKRISYPDDGLGLYNYVMSATDDFQAHLMRIVNQAEGNLPQDYNCGIGMWDYHLIFDYLYTSATVNFVYVNYSTSFNSPNNINCIAYMDWYVKGILDLGHPVVLHIGEYDDVTGVISNYHSVVAYYYDNDGIHVNLGYGANETDVVLSAPTRILQAGRPDFSNLGHSHSDNYRYGTTMQCGCGHVHTHTFDYLNGIPFDSYSHKCFCSCGAYTLDTHTLIKVNKRWRCTVCGYQS